MGWEDISEYHQEFRAKVPQFKAGPVENRSCNDVFCVFIFVLIFIATLGGGIFFILEGNKNLDIMGTMQGIQDNSQNIGYIISRVAGPIVGMLALSSILSFVTVLMAKSFPKVTMYFLIGFTFAVYAALIAVGFIFTIYALAIVFIIVLVINAIMLCCLWDYIKIGLKLMECAARFITEKPSVYFIQIMSLFFNVAFTVFWVYAYLSVYSLSKTQNENKNTYEILTIVWYVASVFWGFFLFYCMTFLVSSACAYWYYQSTDNSVLRGLNNIKYHFGSLTFSSVVITIITVMRILASNNNSENGATRLLSCLMACILRCIEELLKVLNHNAVIVMSVTGESYIDSAKSAISLIFDNLGLFIAVDYFTDFYEFFSTFFISLLPAIIGGGIVYSTETSRNEENALVFAIWSGVIILLLSILISSVIVGMLNQVLSSIFIFYCFDVKFRSLGYEVRNIPKEISDLLDGEANCETIHEATMQNMNANGIHHQPQINNHHQQQPNHHPNHHPNQYFQNNHMNPPQSYPMQPMNQNNMYPQPAYFNNPYQQNQQGY